MKKISFLTIPDVDVLVYVIDATSTRIDNETIQKIKQANKPIILVINKVDLIDKEKVAKKL